MTKSKKIILTVLTMMLVCALSIAGTLAYLQANTETVTNTFSANNNLIEDPATPAEGDDPVGPGDGDKDGFYLTENAVKLNATKTGYELDKEKDATHANTYANVTGGMKVAKNPVVGVQIAEDMVGYVFLEVVPNANLTYAINSTNWKELKSVTPQTTGATVYSLQVGGSDLINPADTVVEYGILDKNEVTVKDGDYSVNDVGTLEFKAYACQAAGFTSAADAWAKAFTKN